MKYKNWDDFKVHCSGVSKVVSKPKKVHDLTKNELKKQDIINSKEVKSDDDIKSIEYFKSKRNLFLYHPLSEIAKDYLIRRYSADRYNIRPISNSGSSSNAAFKGFAIEKDAIQLLSELDNIQYEKPNSAISNDYLNGICDGICLDKNKIIEVKTSWNAENFMSNRKNNRLELKHWWQIQSYLDLYDIDNGQVCFVLLNNPPHLVQQEQALLYKKLAFCEISIDKYEESIEKFNSIYNYNKIPIKRRVIRFDVPRYSDFKQIVYRKVDLCRIFLNEFEKEFMSNKNVLTLPEQYINVTSEEDNTECNTD